MLATFFVCGWTSLQKGHIVHSYSTCSPTNHSNPSPQSCFLPSWSPIYTGDGVTLSQMQHLAFAFVEVCCSCHLISVALQTAALPSSLLTDLSNLVSSINLLGVHSTLSFKSLIKTLNSAIYPRGAPLFHDLAASQTLCCSSEVFEPKGPAKF